MSLTIDMEDEPTSFTFIFKDRASLESWQNGIRALVSLYHAQKGVVRQQLPDPETPRGSEKIHSQLNSSGQSTTSSPGSLMVRQSIGEGDELSNYDEPPTNFTTPHTSPGSSKSLTPAPLPHPQMDLILVISVPPPNSPPSTAQPKITVIKTMLNFLVASLGPKNRLSVVTFEVGMGFNVRQTPFLMLGRSQSRTRLEKFIDEVGVKLDENHDEYLVRGSKEEKTSVVTAVIHGK